MVETTPGILDEEGRAVVQVPNKRIARLIQLGIAQERALHRRDAERKAAKLSRRANRKRK